MSHKVTMIFKNLNFLIYISCLKFNLIITSIPMDDNIMNLYGQLCPCFISADSAESVHNHICACKIQVF